MGSTQVGFSADEATVKALREHAKRQQRSMSFLVGQLVRDFLHANPINIEGGTEPPIQN